MQTFNSIDGSAVGLTPANGSIWVMADIGIYPEIGAPRPLAGEPSTSRLPQAAKALPPTRSHEFN